MDEKTVTFEEKLTQLLELAKSKKNVLENKEILDFFHGEILNPGISWIRYMIFSIVIRWMYCSSKRSLRSIRIFLLRKS